MKFYNQQHKYYCGIDLHARKMFVCILSRKGKVLVHQNIKTDEDRFFELIFPFLEDIVVGVECVFCPDLQSGSAIGHGWPICAPATKSISFSDIHYT